MPAASDNYLCPGPESLLFSLSHISNYYSYCRASCYGNDSDGCEFCECFHFAPSLFF